MKRSVSILSILLFLALLSACTKAPGQDTQQVSVPDSLPEDAEQELPARRQAEPDAALQALTEQEAQQLLTRLGFALLSEFDTPSRLPLARMLYADASAAHAGRASEAASLRSDPAVQRVLAQIPAESSLEDALAGTMWFRRHTLEGISDEFTRLTGADVTGRQISDLTDDARFCWVKSSDGVYYAAGYIQHAPAPVVTQVRRTDSGWQIDYLQTDGAGGASVEWADGQFLCGGTLTLDAQGRVCANRIDVEPQGQLGACVSLPDSQTRELLLQLREMDAETLLSQSFSFPEDADLQALLCCGLIAPGKRAQELRAALGEPSWGTFAAAAPEQIAARLEQLTGTAPDPRQIAALRWPYSEAYDVYYGMVSGVVLPIEDAQAYRTPDGTILLAYAQTVEDASGRSFCGLAVLEDTDGLRIVSNRRYPLQPLPPAELSPRRGTAGAACGHGRRGDIFLRE